jgi:hypothetical protein
LVKLSHLRLQFSCLRGNLVVSDGVEAWILTDGKWERTDALAAFLKSTWLKSDEAIGMFGKALPDLSPEAFVGRKVGRHGLSRTGPRIGRAPLRGVKLKPKRERRK